MATQSKHKKVSGNKQKLKLFRANEPEKSVLMWGINYSMTQLLHVKPRPMLLADDFRAIIKVTVDNYLFNKQNMPSTYKFKEYSPLVFQDLRRRFGVSEADYLESFTKHQPLRQGSASQRKRADFVTNNFVFSIRIMSSEEIDTVQGIMQSYHEYMVNCNGVTRLPQFLGLYRLTVNEQEMYLLVQRNMVFPFPVLSKLYALRGKDKAEHEKEKKHNHQKHKKYKLKDVQFIRDDVKITIGEEEKQKILGELKRDIRFLEKNSLHHFRVVVGISGFASSESMDEEDGGIGSGGDCEQADSDLEAAGTSSDEGGLDATDGRERERQYSLGPLRGVIPEDGTLMDDIMRHYGVRDKNDYSKVYFIGLVDTLRRKLKVYHRGNNKERNNSEEFPYVLPQGAPVPNHNNQHSPPPPNENADIPDPLTNEGSLNSVYAAKKLYGTRLINFLSQRME